MKGELRAKTLRTRGGEKRTRPVLLLEGAALAVGDPTAAVGSSGERGNMTAERAKKVAKEALKTGGDPRLAWQILLSTLTGEEGGAVLEKRLMALLDTVPDDEDRDRLAQMAWGEGKRR
jgi:hypothetical protein